MSSSSSPSHSASTFSSPEVLTPVHSHAGPRSEYLTILLSVSINIRATILACLPLADILYQPSKHFYLDYHTPELGYSCEVKALVEGTEFWEHIGSGLCGTMLYSPQ